MLIALGGEPVFEGAYGLADRSWDVPNEMSTRFDVGSINKDFTKVAVGQLLAAGKLSLDDTVLDLLPDYPNPEVGKRITVRQILAHTSGLGDIFSPEFFRANKALYRTNEDYFDLFTEKPLLFECGSDRRYSNAGYVVLGAIAARDRIAHRVADLAAPGHRAGLIRAQKLVLRIARVRSGSSPSMESRPPGRPFQGVS